MRQKVWNRQQTKLQNRTSDRRNFVSSSAMHWYLSHSILLFGEGRFDSNRRVKPSLHPRTTKLSHSSAPRKKEKGLTSRMNKCEVIDTIPRAKSEEHNVRKSNWQKRLKTAQQHGLAPTAHELFERAPLKTRMRGTMLCQFRSKAAQNVVETNQSRQTTPRTCPSSLYSHADAD